MPPALLQTGAELESLAGYVDNLLGALPRIGLGVAVFVGFYVASRFVEMAGERGLLGWTENRRASTAWGTILRYVTILVGVVAGLTVAGVDLTALVVALGVAGFAVAFAMQETLGNFISGIILLTTHPFSEGDAVEVAGVLGVVETIGIRATKLRTFDGVRVEVPNQKVLNGKISVFNFHDTRRVEFVIGIGYEDSIGRASEIIREAVLEVEDVLPEPDPLVLVQEYDESRVNINVRVWLDTSEGRRSWLITRSEVSRVAKEALEEAGIDVPWPIRTLRYMEDGGRRRPQRQRSEPTLEELEGTA